MKSILSFFKKMLIRAGRPVAGVFGSRLHGFEVRRAATFLAVVVCASTLLVGLFYVWTRMQIVQKGYELSALEAKNEELKNRKRELLLEIASLQSPGELEKKARKLGLVTPAMGKVVHVP
ncbi:MAG: septum formation initiator family protein [Deltaproteobacteria bacterium]|nr:septum formation initiator family protein [Deltaproteobacteria bacterium]